MKKLQWSPRLSLGVVELDAQHRRLLDLTNTLTEAVQMGAEGLVVERILDELADYALTHFHDEERYMERVEFPERSDHAKEHGRFARQIDAYRRSRELDGELDCNHLSSFLRGWLVEHIVYQDADIASYVKRLKMNAGALAAPYPRRTTSTTASIAN